MPLEHVKERAVWHECRVAARVDHEAVTACPSAELSVVVVAPARHPMDLLPSVQKLVQEGPQRLPVVAATEVAAVNHEIMPLRFAADCFVDSNIE